MATVKVTRTIDATIEFVFQTVADPRRFAQAIDGVTQLTFLSQVTTGAGTRFRQTRELNCKAMGAGTFLTMCMTTRSHRLLPRLLMPVVCLLIKKSVEREFDAVKASCEASS